MRTTIKTGLLYMTMMAVTVMSLSGCANNPYASNSTMADADGGALLGGLAGAVIGNQTGSPLTGAVIGAGIGGIGGYAVGHSSNSQRYQQYQQPVQCPPGYSCVSNGG